MAKTEKNKKINDDNEMRNEKALAVKNKMIAFLEQDYESNKNNKPALQRLKHLDELEKQLKNNALQTNLLENGILDVIKQYLEPLPDNTLPNIKIKKIMLEVLAYLPIKRKHIINSNGIGKIVNFYGKNVRESDDIRSMATNLVKKWTYFFVKDEDCDEE
ncbi:Transcription factor iws1 [Binucleata daphniae]